MIQEIIVIVIIAAAAGVVLYRLVGYLLHPLSKCESCAMSCSGCSLEDLKKEIQEKKKSTAMAEQGKR